MASVIHVDIIRQLLDAGQLPPDIVQLAEDLGIEVIHVPPPDGPDGPEEEEPAPEEPEAAAEQPETDSSRGLRGSDVCWLTMLLFGVVQTLLGDQSLEQGDRLESSASMFDEMGMRVAALDPHGGWRGGAAQAYGACTGVQCQQVMAMADMDRLTAELVSVQAEAVRTTRIAIFVLMGVVWVLLFFCWRFEEEPGPAGKLRSLILAVLGCGAVMAVAAGFLIHLADATSRNAHDVQAVAQRVGDLVAAPPTRAGAAVGRPVPASPDAGVSRFALADHNAPSPPIAELGSALAGLPGAPQFHLATEARAGLTDFGAPGLPIPPLTGMPTPPDPAHLPSLPDLPDVSAVLVGLPTIAPLSTALGRFGGLAGPPNAASQLADTATQHTQMIATLTPQHTPRAGNPTPDHDSGSPDTAGAAASTTTNHRAPIDTHARLTPGATQSPLPHSP